MSRTIHIIGAGLAGLSAAVALTKRGETVIVHEQAAIAGGRCRSYHDPAIDMVIDNGNHLLLSGNRAAMDYVRMIGSEQQLVGPDSPEFHFADLATGERWTVRFSDGKFPWWIFDSKKRVPGTRPLDYAGLACLFWARSGASVGETIRCEGAIYDRLMEPLLLAALNTEPKIGSAKLAAAVIRETLAAGGQACRPLIAANGLGPALIEPALEFLGRTNAIVRFNHRLRSIRYAGSRATTLDFGEDAAELAQDDVVILAVPPPVAASIVPNLPVPSEFRSIVNAHFRVKPASDQARMIGVVHGTVEWIFAFADRVSVTISAGDRLLDTPREALAEMIWREVAAITHLSPELPRWQIVREKRATFAATPDQELKRPTAQTAWTNLILAGDWTDTGLPATIEGAIRSGNRAAALIQTYTT